MTLAWQPSGFLQAGGKALEYACWGPPPQEAGTIVLLHEGLGCVALWRDFPLRLSERTGWGVIAYSRAGYGQSDPVKLPRPLDYMTREAVDVLPEVLQAVGSRHCMLLGHSDGATIAAIHAGRIKDPAVRGVALMAPHFFVEDIGLAAIETARVAFEDGNLRSRMEKYHSRPDVAFRGWNDSWLNPDFRFWDVSDVLADIEVPVLAIQGQDDEYGTLEQIDVLEKRCAAPVEKLILPDCRHAPHFDKTAQVLESADGFVNGLPAALPPRAYVPGKTERHPEGWFDPIRATVRTGMSDDALSRTSAFRTGLAYLDAGYFWEAHELLEPVWMALPHGSPARAFVQGVIQLANGRLKILMDRPAAALRLADIARSLVMQADAKEILGQRVSRFASEIDSLTEQAKLAL